MREIAGRLYDAGAPRASELPPTPNGRTAESGNLGVVGDDSGPVFGPTPSKQCPISSMGLTERAQAPDS